MHKPVAESKDKLTSKQASLVLTRYATQYQLTPSQALNSISYFIQDGGSIKKEKSPQPYCHY